MALGISQITTNQQTLQQFQGENGSMGIKPFEGGNGIERHSGSISFRSLGERS